MLNVHANIFIKSIVSDFVLILSCKLTLENKRQTDKSPLA